MSTDRDASQLEATAAFYRALLNNPPTNAMAPIDYTRYQWYAEDLESRARRMREELTALVDERTPVQDDEIVAKIARPSY